MFTMFSRFILVWSLLFLVSCASAPKGGGEAELAAGLAGQQRYRDAIAAMDQAIAKEPQNASYKAARERYIADYTQQVLGRARGLSAASSNKGDIDDVEKLLDDALESGVPKSSLSSAYLQIQSTRTALYEDLERLYRDGVDAMDDGEWVAAYEALTRVQSRYPNYEDVSPRLGRVREQAAKQYLGEAGRAFRDDELTEARKAANNLLAIDPSNSIARGLLGRIDERDNKAYFADKAQAAIDANDQAGIAKYCGLVLGYDQADEMCIAAEAALAKDVSAQLVSDGKRASNGGMLFNAADHYFELHQYEDWGIPASRAALQRDLAQRLYRAADTAAEEGQYGLAWVLFEKLAEVSPNYPGLSDARRQVEDAIWTRTRKSIAVFDFNSPADSTDAGIIVANSLISRLFNNAGRDIKILERENLRSILEEMKLGQIGVVSEETAKEMGRIHGIDYAIMGSVLLFKVDTHETNSSKTVRYPVGEDIQDNIEYLNWLATNPNPSRKQLKDAPPAKVMVTRYETTEYDVVEIKKVGFLSLSFRIVDVSTGENTRVDTLERKLEFRDVGSEGLADAGIEYDPAEVPTDTELLQMLTDQVIDTMSVDVLRPLQSLEKSYFETGEEYEKRNEQLRAVERYVDSIFNERMKSVNTSPLTEESMARINRIMHEQRFET